MSKIKEQPGSIYFPIKNYLHKKQSPADLKLVVFHHPFNWLSQNIYREFRSEIRSLGDIIISGHEHAGNVGHISESESTTSTFIEGCALQPHGNSDRSSFNLITIDLSQSQFSSTRYNLTGGLFVPTEEGSWSDYRNLPIKSTSEHPLTAAFEQVLDDPGAFFRHPSSRPITLSDIYVYPDLRKISDNSGKRDLISSAKLISPEATEGGVIVEGEEKAGCTSLFYQLFRAYHSRGYIPLIISGTSIKGHSAKDIDNILNRAIKEQYGKDATEKIAQIPPSKKILFIDNFDSAPLKATSARANLLCQLNKRFKHLAIGVCEMFEIRELLAHDESEFFLSLEHYKIQHFGYSLRSKLIERWFSVGNDGSIDESTLIARCDEAEKLMNIVMAKTITPSLPLYLLTLLQSLESGRSSEFKESALGYYYQYLLTESFGGAGIKKEKLTEHFQYAAQLAWEFHKKNMPSLSEGELRDFNRRFCDTWHTVDFRERVETLQHAKVLIKNGDEYRFRYPYIYYLLKGKYISDNLQDIQVREYIKHCCKHLYVRDHANTILFVAHHSNDEFILDQIASSLGSLFTNWQPLRLDGDTAAINKLIANSPKLSYTGESPKDHRNKRNEIKDQLDTSDGLLEKEESSDQLSLFAEVTTLVKNLEILGQVLKNQYSRIPRIRKYRLIEDLFNAPLRALQDFYNFLESNPDSLVKEIDNALKRKGNITDIEERERLARKVAASLVQALTFGFFMRASQGANSESLAEEVSNVVSSNGTTAFKIIEIGMKLDSPRDLPRAALRELFHTTKNDITSARLLKMFVLHRLYMFKTSERDMQWLRDELELDIDKQHLITYQEREKRRVR